MENAMTDTLLQHYQAMTISDRTLDRTMDMAEDAMGQTPIHAMVQSSGDGSQNPIHYLPSLLSHTIYTPNRSPSVSGSVLSAQETSTSLQVSPARTTVGALRRRQSLPILGGRERGSLVRTAWSIRLPMPSRHSPSLHRPRRGVSGTLTSSGHRRRWSILPHPNGSGKLLGATRIRKTGPKVSRRHTTLSRDHTASMALVPYSRLEISTSSDSTPFHRPSGNRTLSEEELIEGIRSLCLLPSTSQTTHPLLFQG
ncbi:hypothetical protein BJ684DRAFT_20012 [Piptocephalis cylindrospora]|uniref:Uncharacterized protein n=1 Tax=Piptocephalis cylindrospora TaxID=1907219 RepID=A0A4P9Y3K6_9FUNG|nr:hypothetical protein BJ684DRAFT_20012 [Piptocephalis cylindrospora]|eukprot:RKP13506.1 hypothetical protein BJ684DRAFT_20012 [Piptocephalis cylindrospora]